MLTSRLKFKWDSRVHPFGSSLLLPQSSSPLQYLSKEMHCPVSQRSSLSLHGSSTPLSGAALLFFCGIIWNSELALLSSVGNSSVKSCGQQTFKEASAIIKKKVRLFRASSEIFMIHIFGGSVRVVERSAFVTFYLVRFGYRTFAGSVPVDKEKYS